MCDYIKSILNLIIKPNIQVIKILIYIFLSMRYIGINKVKYQWVKKQKKRRDGK